MNARPRVSFNIPTLDRDRTLAVSLRSIIEQDYPEIEIVIVDGGSRDSTLEIAREFTSKIIHNNGPLGEARQVAFENSFGEIIAVFDSDITIPSRHWLENAVARFSEDNRIGIVQPVNKPPSDASLTARCYFAFWKARRTAASQSKGEYLAGGNSLFLREAIMKAGGFNKSLRFGEDLELSARIARLGYTTVFHDDPLIHDTMWSLKEYTRKQLWGASALADSRDIRVATLSVGWLDTPLGNTLDYAAVSAMKHIITGLRAMIYGLSRERDPSWLMIPILLGIRIMVYAGSFLSRTLIR